MYKVRFFGEGRRNNEVTRCWRNSPHPKAITMAITIEHHPPQTARHSSRLRKTAYNAPLRRQQNSASAWHPAWRNANNAVQSDCYRKYTYTVTSANVNAGWIFTKLSLLQCESKKLHHFIFAITLSNKALFNNFWHTYSWINFLLQAYFVLFVYHKTRHHLEICFCLLFSRLTVTDMANTN